MSGVDDFVKRKTACQQGTRAVVMEYRDDIDTVCEECPLNTFKPSNSSSEQCIAITPCIQGSTDASTSAKDISKRTQDSVCVADLDLTKISLRQYANLDDAATFEFGQHRSRKVVSYSACIESGLIDCSVNMACTDIFYERWVAGDIRLGQQECQTSCSAGFSLQDQKCVACSPGKFKSSTGSKECSDCVPGKYSKLSGALECDTCGPGFYTLGGTECRACCQVNLKYSAPSLCYKPDHYIVPGMCETNRGRINIEKCDNDVKVPATITQFSWDTTSIAHCLKFLPPRQTCERDFYSFNSECQPCQYTALFFRLKCGATKKGVYLEDKCVAGFNTMCGNCPPLPNLAELDVDAISSTLVTKSAQCKFRCVARSGVFYVKSRAETAYMLQVDLNVLVTRLDATWPNSYCIRSTVDSELFCKTNMMELEMDSATYPRIRCVAVEQQCLSKNGVRLQTYLNAGSTLTGLSCECREGFYGTYHEFGTRDLDVCKMCPPHMTSITGTISRLGCFCMPGYYQDSSNQNTEVCQECNNRRGGRFYCPGGQVFGVGFEKHSVDYSGKEQALHELTLLPVGRHACPTNTHVVAAAPSSIFDCVGLDNVVQDINTGVFLSCDIPPFVGDYFSTWLPIKSRGPCQRECVAPHSLKNSDGNCRCNAAMGYDFAPTSGKCQCKPGYYKQVGGSLCVLCPANSFCTGGDNPRVPCNIQSVSDVGSTSVEQCFCLLGFYLDQVSSRCIMCARGTTCYKNKQFTCSLYELCQERAMFKPVACEAGRRRPATLYTTTCSHGVYSNPTPGQSTLLIRNSIQVVETQGVMRYAVNNPALVDILHSALHAVFVNQLKDQKIQWTGFMSHFDFLCSRHGSFAIPMLDDGGIFKNMQCFVAETPNFLVNIVDSMVPSRPVGRSGLFSHAYHHPTLPLLTPDNHLLWRVFFACVSESAQAYIGHTAQHNSEIGPHCTHCNTEGDPNAFIQLEHVYSLRVLRDDTKPYLIKTVHVALDTATQHAWTAHRRVGSGASRYSAFMELLHSSNADNVYVVLLRIISTNIDKKDAQFTEEATLSYLSQTTQHRIVFGLHVPVAGFMMAYNRIAFVGVCHSGSPDTLTLLVFNLYDRIVSPVVLNNCVQCCADEHNSENVHAYYDVVFHTLFVGTKKNIHHATFSDLTYQSQRMQLLSILFPAQRSDFFFMGQTALKITDRIFETTSRAGRCLPGPMIFFIVDKDNVQTSRIAGIAVRYCFTRISNVNEVDTNAYNIHGDSTMHTLFTNTQVVTMLQQKRNARHFPFSSPSSHQNINPETANMRIASFSIINNRKWNTTIVNSVSLGIREVIEMVVVHTADTNPGTSLHEQLVSYIVVRGSTVSVEILATVFREDERVLQRILYSIVPVAVDETHRNHILATSVVILTYHTAGGTDFVFYNFSCFSCDRATSETSAAHHNCPCVRGTAPVCVPCGLDCDINTYIAGDGIGDDMCYKANALKFHSRQTYNFYCMPCAGSIYCINGTVAGVQLCPPETPFSINARSSSVLDCVCDVNQTHRSVSLYSNSNSTMQHYTVNGSLSNLGSTCRSCTVHEVCTPRHTAQKRNVQCPENTVSTAQLTVIDDVNATQQKCACTPGFYRQSASVETYKVQANNIAHAYSWKSNSILSRATNLSRAVFSVVVERCVPCETGFFCRQSHKYPCPVGSTTRRTGATQIAECYCAPGYGVHQQQCGPCQEKHICSGDFNFLVTTCRDHKMCPCPAGEVYNVQKLECVVGAAGFYSPGFSSLTNFTGVNPRDFLYAQRCTPFSTSRVGALHISECICEDGRFMNQGHLCEICPLGYYCAVSLQQSCPPRTRTTRTGAKHAEECECIVAEYERHAVSGQCVCSGGRVSVALTEECVNCQEFPAKIANANNQCECAPGFFQNIEANCVFFHQNTRSRISGTHPLSPDLRETMRIYSETYGKDLSMDSARNASQCLPCPPGASCRGSSHLLEYRTHYGASTAATYVSLTGVLSNQSLWTAPCPYDRHEKQFRRTQTGLGISSCFYKAEALSTYESSVVKISHYTFPAVLVVSIGDNSASTISSIMSTNKTYYTDEIVANYRVPPSMLYVNNNAVLPSSYIFVLDINTIQVAIRHSFAMNQKQYVLHEALRQIDMGSGVAFGSLTPILWALLISQRHEGSGVSAVFIVPGVVENILVRTIVERTITVVMTVLQITGPRPLYVFAVSTHQFFESRGLHELVEQKLMYLHRNLCSGFYQDNSESDYTCVNKVESSYLSTFEADTVQNAVFLRGAENLVSSPFVTEVRALIGLGVKKLAQESGQICPQKMVQKTEDGLHNTMCYVCDATHFFRNGICVRCNLVSDSVCPLPFLVKTCAWTHNSKCIDLSNN